MGGVEHDTGVDKPPPPPPLVVFSHTLFPGPWYDTSSISITASLLLLLDVVVLLVVVLLVVLLLLLSLLAVPPPPPPLDRPMVRPPGLLPVAGFKVRLLERVIPAVTGGLAVDCCFDVPAEMATVHRRRGVAVDPPRQLRHPAFGVA